MSITTLATLETGKAYIIYVNSAVTITFPAKASAPPVSPTPIIQLPTGWVSVESTPNTHLVVVPKDVCQMLEVGDVVCAFNTQGINTGHAVYRGESFALAVYGDDQYTTDVDGMLDGEEMTIKVYRPSTGEVFVPDMVFDPEMPDAKNYITNGLSRLVLKTGIEDFNSGVKVNIYPNPASDYLSIDLGGNTMDNSHTLTIINSVGKSLYNGFISTGSRTQIDVSEWAEGFYFVKMISSQKTIVKKIVIKK